MSMRAKRETTVASERIVQPLAGVVFLRKPAGRLERQRTPDDRGNNGSRRSIAFWGLGCRKRDLVLLGHVFEVARKEWGIFVHNPVRDIKLPPGRRPRDRRMQPGEETRLFTACREARNRWLPPMVRLALENAMRQGELLRLRSEHIGLVRRTAHLPDTKNGEARTVPLSTTAVAVLRALPRALQGGLFPGVSTEAVKRSYMRAIRRAGIEGLRFHDLRHEATTTLFEKRLNVMEVASITRHKDLRMLRRCTHLKAEDLARKLG